MVATLRCSACLVRKASDAGGARKNMFQLLVLSKRAVCVLPKIFGPNHAMTKAVWQRLNRWMVQRSLQAFGQAALNAATETGDGTTLKFRSRSEEWIETPETMLLLQYYGKHYFRINLTVQLLIQKPQLQYLYTCQIRCHVCKTASQKTDLTNGRVPLVHGEEQEKPSAKNRRNPKRCPFTHGRHTAKAHSNAAPLRP